MSPPAGEGRPHSSLEHLAVLGRRGRDSAGRHLLSSAPSFATPLRSLWASAALPSFARRSAYIRTSAHGLSAISTCPRLTAFAARASVRSAALRSLRASLSRAAAVESAGAGLGCRRIVGSLGERFPVSSPNRIFPVLGSSQTLIAISWELTTHRPCLSTARPPIANANLVSHLVLALPGSTAATVFPPGSQRGSSFRRPPPSPGSRRAARRRRGRCRCPACRRRAGRPRRGCAASASRWPSR